MPDVYRYSDLMRPHDVALVGASQRALDVARALKDHLEMLEQPTAPSDLAGLRQVTEFSPVPILADQSVTGPASALELAAGRAANGVSVKLATCGGLRCARQIDAIARAAHIATMISCFIEPALLVAAGLSLALSSPNVRYGDLDGYIDLINDPSKPGFRFEDGWLIASDVPGGRPDISEIGIEAGKEAARANAVKVDWTRHAPVVPRNPGLTALADYPLDVLKRAGVDLTSPQPVDAAFEVMADYVTRLEKLLA